MKPKIRNHSLLAALLAALVAATAPTGAATVTWDSDGTTTSGPADGTGGLTKKDASTLTLSGANTFSRQLTVQNGTLFSRPAKPCRNP